MTQMLKDFRAAVKKILKQAITHTLQTKAKIEVKGKF